MSDFNEAVKDLESKHGGFLGVFMLGDFKRTIILHVKDEAPIDEHTVELIMEDIKQRVCIDFRRWDNNSNKDNEVTK